MTKNEIVARFYGYEFINDTPDFYPDGYYMLRQGDQLTLPINAEDFNFNTSYDWFMLVWIKFRDLKFEDDEQAGPITMLHIKLCASLMHTITYKSITEAFDELVKGIEWVNSLNTENVVEPCPNCKEKIKWCACMRNTCNNCGKPVGNITFTVCDDCWDLEHGNKNK